jgi:predicted dehydrogenase
MTAPLRVAVFGAGRMGKLHARVYGEIPGAQLVAIIDPDEKRAADVAREHGGRPLKSVDALRESIDAASVAVPTSGHLEVARPLIERGLPLLIEKPIAATPDEAEQLLALARRHDCLVAVGHSERFNPVVQAMLRMGVSPKFVETHRISPFTFRSADIGVVMDMMIHDIDIVLHMVKAKPVSVDAVGVNVLGPHEDIANARIRFENGCVVNLTASRLALKTERKIRVFSEAAYLSLDYQKRTGIAIKKDANLDILKMARERNAEDLSQLQGADFGSLIKVEPLMITSGEPLRAELEAFLDAVRTRQPAAVVSAEDGVAAVKLAHDIVDSLKSHGFKSPGC